MGKNRERADRLFQALEKELAIASGKDEARLGKKARAQLIARAKKKKLPLEAIIEEAKPALMEVARITKTEKSPTLH